jgi:uncharacterized protein DUF2460
MATYLTDISTQVWQLGITNSGAYVTTPVTGPTGVASILLTDTITAQIWALSIQTSGALTITLSSGTAISYIPVTAPDGVGFGIEVSSGSIDTFIVTGGASLTFLQFPLTFGGNIGFPIKQTPIFNTIIQSSASGRGQLRIPLYEFPLWDFVLDVSYLQGDNQGTNTQWQELINFYMAVQGAASSWLFLHPYDNNVGTFTINGSVTSGRFFQQQPHEFVIQTGTGAIAQLLSVFGSVMTIWPYSGGTPNNSGTWVGQSTGAVFTPSAALPVLASSMNFATGDGSTTAFSIIRSVVTNGAQDLVQNFVNPPNIYVSGSLVSSSAYTIDQYGTITFTSAPGVAAPISWTGNFFYLCSFVEDMWNDLEETFYQIWQLDGLKFRSVLL